MAKSRVVQRVLWALVILSPFVSALFIGVATGTAFWAIDAWNTTWNDEQTYFSVVQQMREFGEPTGMNGYNEVTAERLSYGPYTPPVFAPYYLASLVTGLGSHNFMYIANVLFGVIAAALVVLMLRPTARESLLCAALFAFQFIISRYVFSGMSEGSFLVFSSLVACGSVWLIRSYKRPDSGGVHVRNDSGAAARIRSLEIVVLVLMIAAIGLWGIMRPFLLAFVLVPIALLIARTCNLSMPARVALCVLAVVVSFASLAGYIYFGKYYGAPYFEGESIANSLDSLLSNALGNLVGLHVDAVTYLGKSLVMLHWQGIMTAWFVLEWVVLLVIAIRERANPRGPRFLLLVAVLLAGAALFEANLLLYSPKQLHRSLIAPDAVFALLIVFLFRPKVEGRRVIAPIVLTAFVSLACAGSLIVHPDEFDFPQEDSRITMAYEDEARAELASLMPRGEDPWDNTIAHPVENVSFQIYFCIPAYQSINCCTQPYLKKAIEKGTLKSKYLSLPFDHSLNRTAKKKYEVVYRKMGHTIYRVR